MLRNLTFFVGVAPALTVWTNQETTSDAVDPISELEQAGVHMNVGDLLSFSLEGVSMASFDYPKPEANFRVISTESGKQQVLVNNAPIT